MEQKEKGMAQKQQSNSEKPAGRRRKKRTRNGTSRAERWFYRNRATVISVGVVVVLFLWLYGSRFVQIFRLMGQKRDLTAQLQQEKTRKIRLDEEIRQINTRHYTEYIAHKNLNLYYPEEKIIIRVKTEAEAKAQKAKKKRAEKAKADQGQAETQTHNEEEQN
jgi:hypothetical protein